MHSQNISKQIISTAYTDTFYLWRKGSKHLFWNTVAAIDFENKAKNCSHHNSLNYPIYDSYVDVVLRYFRNCDRFSEFQNGDLRDYIKLKSILIDFRAFYDLEKFDLKQIDQYIWLLGKEYFPKNYGKKSKAYQNKKEGMLNERQNN